MKARVIHTKIWKDDYVGSLTMKEKLFFIYLLTNDKINICGIYELSDREIKFDIGLSDNELQTLKAKFEADKKFAFKDGWIRAFNVDKYQDFSGSKNDIARDRELLLAPQSLKEYPMDTLSTISDSLSNQYTVISNKKLVISNIYSDKKFLESDELKQHLYEKFPMIRESAIKTEIEKMIDWVANAGKKGIKKDYRAFARNWIRDGLDKLPKKVFKETWKAPVEDYNFEGFKKSVDIKKQFKVGRDM